jgi:1-acyl-sn-glycerol-3-phosphate acyltransferase
MIRSSIFNVLFYSFSFVMALVCWVIAKVSTRHAMWYALRFWGKGVVFLLRWVMGSRVEVRNAHHMKPGEAQLIVSKHQSELDIVMLTAAMWDVTAIAMKELEKLPFFGTILRKLECVIVAVDAGPQGRTEQAVVGALRVREQRRGLVVYPEGELMMVGARERYRRGVGRIYEAVGVEAVPVAMSLGVVWPQRRWRKNPGTLGIMEFLEPIPPGLPFEEFMAEIERRIEARSMELIEETAPPHIVEEARDRFARGINNHGQTVESPLRYEGVGALTIRDLPGIED